MAADTIACIVRFGLATHDHITQLKNQLPVQSGSASHQPETESRLSVSPGQSPFSGGASTPPYGGGFGGPSNQFSSQQRPLDGYGGSLTSSQAPAPAPAAAKTWTGAAIEDALLRGQTDVLQHLRTNPPAGYEVRPVVNGIVAIFVGRETAAYAKAYILLDGFDIVNGSNSPLIEAWFDCPSGVLDGNETPQCERSACYSGHHVVDLYNRIAEGARLATFLPALKCQKGKLVAS
jgi:hypothetical protein